MDPGTILGIVALLDRVYHLIRVWVGAVRNAPNEIRMLQIETSSLREIFSTIDENENWDQGRDAMIALCEKHLKELQEQILPLPKHSTLDRFQIAEAWRLKWPGKRAKAQEILRDIQTLRQNVMLQLSRSMRLELSEIRDEGRQIRENVNENRLERLMQWIAPLNVQYESSFVEALAKAWPGTGEWLFEEGGEFSRWRDSEDAMPVFCVHGPGGSGKTVLSSLVLEHLLGPLGQRSGSQCVLYCYFDYRDAPKNKVSCLLDCLLRQLVHYDHAVLHDVEILRAEFASAGQPPPRDGVLNLIRTIIKDISRHTTVYILIDAIEECTDFFEEGKGIISLFRELVRWTQRRPCLDPTHLSDERSGVNLEAWAGPRTIRVFLTANDQAYSRLEKAKVFTSPTDLYLPNDRRVVEDMKRYVEGSVGAMGDDAMQAIRDVAGLLQLIIDTISGHLWIHTATHVEMIKSRRTVADIKLVLANIKSDPKGHSAYQRSLEDILSRISLSEARHLRTMLIILCQASYCLLLPEFTAMVTASQAAQNEHNFIDATLLPWNHSDFVSILSPFHRINSTDGSGAESTSEINLRHSTMESFFQQKIEHAGHGPLTNGSSMFPWVRSWLGRQPTMFSEDERGGIPSVNAIFFSQMEAQIELAEACARYLGASDFKLALTQKYPELQKWQRIPSRSNDTNPFKQFPAAIRTLDRRIWAVRVIEEERRDRYPALEYCCQNLPHHLRMAAFLDYRDNGGKWLRELKSRPHIRWMWDVAEEEAADNINGAIKDKMTEMAPRAQNFGPWGRWITGAFSFTTGYFKHFSFVGPVQKVLGPASRTKTDDGRYKSWQEAHAYFCWEERCGCSTFAPPSQFLKDLRLQFLLNEPNLGCLWCASPMTPSPTRGHERQHGEDKILCEPCLCDYRQTARIPNTGDLPPCGLTYRVMQEPEAMRRTLDEAGELDELFG